MKEQKGAAAERKEEQLPPVCVLYRHRGCPAVSGMVLHSLGTHERYAQSSRERDDQFPASTSFECDGGCRVLHPTIESLEGMEYTSSCPMKELRSHHYL